MTITPSNLPTTTHTQTNDDDLATFVWVAMGEIYGNQWLSAFGEEPNQQWELAISNLTRREILLAIELCKCKYTDSRFPPNLTQFLNYCKTPDFKKKEADTQKLLSRPRWQGNDSVRDAELSKIHALLGMRKQMPREDSEKRRVEILKNAENFMKQQDGMV